MTGSEFVLAVRTEIVDPRGTGHNPATVLHHGNKFMRQAASEVARLHLSGITGLDIQVDETSLVAGTANYAEPSDYWLYDSAWIDNSTDELIFVPFADLKRMEATGVIKYISRNGGYFYLCAVPASGGTLNLHYYAQPTAIENTDESTVPGGGIFDDVAIEYTAMRLHLVDRFAKYDITAEIAAVREALARAGFDALQSSPTRPSVRCSTWAYRVKNRQY